MVDADKTKKAFYATDPDIKYLSKVVYDWLVKNGRLRSPKYVMGESYGGYRGPRIAYELQSQIGVGVNGLILVSPYLDPAAEDTGSALSPLPWMIYAARRWRRPTSSGSTRSRRGDGGASRPTSAASSRPIC